MTNEQKEKIIRFRRQGLGYADIGRELDISKDTVKSFCRRNGLMISDCNPVDDKDRCRECGKPIVQQEKMKKRIFCCKSCREKWWTEHADRMTAKPSTLLPVRAAERHSQPMGTRTENTAPTGVTLRTDSEEVLLMSEKQFQAEMLYYISISIAKSMLENGVIDKEVFAIIDTKLLEKYCPISATLLSGNPLT